MKLKYSPRSIEKKSLAKQLRREGFIPAVIYGKGTAGENIAIESVEFAARLRGITPGTLPTSVFSLVDDSGKERRVIVKDIQYDITTYNVINLDFEELHENVHVNVKVPIECIGAADSPGVKVGGVLRQPIRYLRVRCLPKHLPQVFHLDVSGLNMKQSRRLKDLQIPQEVRPLADLNEVAAVIVKR